MKTSARGLDARLGWRVSTWKRFLLVLTCVSICGAQAGTEGSIGVYQVKAAFIYNFAKFVEWPHEAFKDSNERISICVLGRNPFGSLLADTVEGKIVGNRKFAVSLISNLSEGRTCHILFVSAPQSKPARILLEEAKNPYLLTVGESNEFLAGGGMINLRVQDSHVRIEINREAASAAKFRISSRLLSLAATD
jgi:hypothetical protein